MFDILLVFIALKLVGAVDWSWWVVFIPAWMLLGEFIVATLYTWWSCLDL